MTTEADPLNELDAADGSSPDGSASQQTSQQTSRRAALRVAGAAAVGATAAVIASNRVVADDGIGLTAGAPTTATSPVRSTFLGGRGDIGYLFEAGTTDGSNASIYPAVIGAWARADGGPEHGVYSVTDRPNGVGLIGRGLGPDGTGIRASGTRQGGDFSSIEPNSTGVSGFGAVGGRFQSFEPEGVGAVFIGGSADIHLQPSGVAPPDTLNDGKMGAVKCDADGNFWVCVDSASPGTWRKLAGPATAGSFHPIVPARIYDSRRDMTPTETGPLDGVTDREIPVADQRDVETGVIIGKDVVPPGATAISYNLAIVNTAGDGYLFVGPGESTVVTAATINWSASNDGAISNAAIVKLSTDRTVKVFCRGEGASTNVTIDITGYYV